MKPLISGIFNFFSDVNPPMDVELRIKSTDRFYEKPETLTLRSDCLLTIEEHLERLGGRYDLWQLAPKVEDTVTITFKGVEHKFHGDALTSPIHEAQAFLQAELEKEMLF